MSNMKHSLRCISIHYFMMKGSPLPMRAKIYVKIYLMLQNCHNIQTLLYHNFVHSPSKHLEYHHNHNTALLMLLSIYVCKKSSIKDWLSHCR